MKKLGLFLLKNNIHLMTLVFIGFAIWAGLNWSDLLLVQKLVMGMFAFMVAHEYEETLSHPGLMDLIGPAVGIDPNAPTPGKSHLAQATYVVILFALALLFPTQLWVVLPVFILGIFEGFVHTMGSFLFKLSKPSAGWYTAIMMCVYSIWALVMLNRNVEYESIQWLWASLYYVGLFALLEAWFQHLIGSSLPHFARSMMAYVFGKK